MEAWSYRNDSFVWWLVVEISQGSVDWRPMMINLCSIIPLDQTDAIDRNEMMRWCDEPVDASCFCTIVIAKYAFSCWVERTWVNALKKACLSVVNGDLSIDGWWNCKRTLIVGAWINQKSARCALVVVAADRWERRYSSFCLVYVLRKKATSNSKQR